ncbi:MAG: hypothetical protein IPL46_11310 [Saprospiraceae bacterium]|nr:hypothetical protein [Saprospiraceae bacterium]
MAGQLCALKHQTSIQGIPFIDLTDPAFWEAANFKLSEFASNPLNKNNELITFTDRDDKRMGSIRAVSIEDWANVNLNPIFLSGLRDAITQSKVD